MSDPNLITTYAFQGKQYLVKMNVVNGCLELVLTNKESGEEWECNYDVSYIENVTRKTGNFKQFEIFTTMLKSGLLKTTECVELDLLTYEDLDLLRLRRIRNYSSTRFTSSNNNNRRYLILTYSVEFDRINYPLPLEYCGPPDPVILQTTVRRLEAELSRAKEELKQRDGHSRSVEKEKTRALQERWGLTESFMKSSMDELAQENVRLRDQVDYLSRSAHSKPRSQVCTFQRAISQIEKNLTSERKSHHKLLERLQQEKVHLTSKLEKLRLSEKSLRSKLDSVMATSRHHEAAQITTLYRRAKSPKTTATTTCKSTKTVRSRSGSRSESPLYDALTTSAKQATGSRSSSASSKRRPIVSRSRGASPGSGKSSLKSGKGSRSVSPDLRRLEQRVDKMFQRRA